MTIEKGDKLYLVDDAGNSWAVKRILGNVTVKYSIEKALAPDAETLKEYILANDELF